MNAPTRTLSIRRKLMLIIMTASTVALLLVSAGFVIYEVFMFRRAMLRDLSSLADWAAAQNTATLVYDDKAAAEEYLRTLSTKKHITAAAIYQHNPPELFARYPTSGESAARFPAQPEPSGARFEDDHLVVFQEILLQGERIGTVYLQSDLKEMRERLLSYSGIILLLILASSVVTYFLSSGLQQIISRPISHLAQTAKIVSMQKNYSVRAEKHAPDELGQLIDGFNEMLTQIQQRDAALQQANDQLEKRVQERTQDLQMEISERRRAEAALQDQFARTSLLNHITQVISERQDLESILYVVLRQLEDHCAVELGVVCLFDRDTETLNVAALRVKNPLLAPKLGLQEAVTLRLEETGLRMCKHGEIVSMPDTRKVGASLAEQLATTGFHAAVAIPLMVENKLFGVLLTARLRPDSFTSAEHEFLRTMSDQVALAAHQAQLHAELARAYNDLRRTQQTIMQQERLKALGQMASGIAHDINNALSPVVGFADLLARSEAALSSNGKKYLQYIKTAGEDIAHIVARLREFYRRREEAEKLQAVNLNDLAAQVIDMTRPRWRDIPQGRGIMVEMVTEFDSRVPELVCIESEVREAMTNLILNAVDAIPAGGTISVRTAMACPQTGTGNAVASACAILEVRDTGTGMDEETRKRCLEPFFSTKGKRGTGLGLAMVYGVMERHDGKIEIESEPGKGTVVRLIFPVRTLTANGILHGLPEQPLKPLRILCIDDEPLVRELLKEMLERDGHSVELSDSGQVGVEAFRAAGAAGRPFDAVITDLGMPYLDGRQVARVLKRESPSTPVIMLTGWGAFMKEDGDTPSQVDGILSKPPRSAEIRDALRRVTSAETASEQRPTWRGAPGRKESA